MYAVLRYVYVGIRAVLQSNRALNLNELVSFPALNNIDYLIIEYEKLGFTSICSWLVKSYGVKAFVNDGSI